MGLCVSQHALLVRGSSRPDTVLRSRPAHLRVTVVVAIAPAARPQHHHDQQPPPITKISAEP